MSYEFQKLYDAAVAAGQAAAEACTPVPMIVGEATSLFGNEIDTTKKTYYVPEGVCGFAWVMVKPGNCKFANWLKKMKYARPDTYYGGVSIYVGAYNQSMEKKAAYAGAFASVIYDAGVAKDVYSRSQMD